MLGSGHNQQQYAYLQNIMAIEKPAHVIKTTIPWKRHKARAQIHFLCINPEFNDIITTRLEVFIGVYGEWQKAWWEYEVKEVLNNF